MIRWLTALLLMALFVSSQGQIYVLKDHRDSIPEQSLYDSLPIMTDSFYQSLLMQNVRTIKNFVPTVSHLKSTFDTLDVKYNRADVLMKQQIMQKKLERSYSKILKRAEKRKLTFKRYSVVDKKFTYGKDANGNEFCYVTYICKKNRKKMEISYLAIKLNGCWFVADELSIIIL